MVPPGGGGGVWGVVVALGFLGLCWVFFPPPKKKNEWWGGFFFYKFFGFFVFGGGRGFSFFFCGKREREREKERKGGPDFVEGGGLEPVKISTGVYGSMQYIVPLQMYHQVLFCLMPVKSKKLSLYR